MPFLYSLFFALLAGLVEVKARLHRQAAIAARRDNNSRAVPAGPTAEAARHRLQELGA